MSAPTSPPSTPAVAAAARDLSDDEFAQLEDLLEATPPPLEPLDVVMLDGFLCGVLVQPVLLEVDAWMPHVFDFDGRPLPDEADPAWLARTTALILRRHAALNRAIVEDGWFDPLVLEFDEANPIAVSEYEAAASLTPVSQALMPWVAGFQHAASSFPDLEEMDDEAVHTALARLYRHLPAEDPQEREVVATLDRENPLAGLDEAIEDLVLAVADLADLTRERRYHVEPVRREAAKVGRNDPCPCGSGRKYKVCHGVS
jgi:uncharacterized protein